MSSSSLGERGRQASVRRHEKPAVVAAGMGARRRENYSSDRREVQ